MATYINPYGLELDVFPEDGCKFTLEELHKTRKWLRRKNCYAGR